MLMKMCARCQKLVPHPMRYCIECQEIVEKQKEERQKLYDKRYNQKREEKLVKFRKSKEWINLKNKYLQDLQHKYGIKFAYKCEDCIEEYFRNNEFNIKDIQPAEEVHHIEPIETDRGWIRRLDYYNLRALCNRHHNKRHNRFQKKGGKNNATN